MHFEFEGAENPLEYDIELLNHVAIPQLQLFGKVKMDLHRLARLEGLGGHALAHRVQFPGQKELVAVKSLQHKMNYLATNIQNFNF
jgi:hypothetical protein